MIREKTLDVEMMKQKLCHPLKDSIKEEESWRYFDVTNCYSYALGLLVDISFLRPGEISNMEYKSQYTDDEILERFLKDAEVLGLEVFKSCLEEKVEDEYSWKIAIMNTGIVRTHSIYDYHFLKQGMNQKWYHKHPYEQFPTQYDARHRVINDPETANYSYGYHLVGYFVVRKKVNKNEPV